MTRTLFTLVIGTILAGMPAYAHHSFAGYYFEDQSITIQGEVAEFHFRNPHAILVVNAPDPEGVMRTYAAEFGSPRQLAQRGFTKDTLRPGDMVIVTGSPGRVASEYKVHLKSVQRMSDGWSWSGGRRRR